MRPCTVRLVAPESALQHQPVAIAVVIENPSDEPVDLHLQGREIVFDVMVTGEDGHLVWQRENGVTQAILRLETLAPGAAIRLEEMWDQTDLSGQPVDAGLYTIHGTVPTDSEPLYTQDHQLDVRKS